MSSVTNLLFGPEQESPDWLSALGSIRDRITPAVNHYANLHDIAPLDLELRTMLHLPRFGRRELDNQDLLSNEIERLAAKISELQSEYKHWTRQKATNPLDKHAVQVHEVPQEIGTIIHEKFHYIGVAREGRHFALYISEIEVPAALVTLSDLDVEKLKTYLPINQKERSLLLSRMFAFRWAPKNSISYLLGRVSQRIKKERGVASLLTWVNPNLGFHAATYRAANWTWLGSEPVIYRYVGGDYMTARQLYESRDMFAMCVETSKVDLAPLQVWQYRNLV